MSETMKIADEQRDVVYFMSLVQNFRQIAWIGLGKIAAPGAENEEVDLDQAKYAIDMLGMLQRRTKGNLSNEEDRDLGQILYTLRMNYVDEAENAVKRSNERAAGEEPPAEADEPDETPADGSEEE
jgi:hypothetical protein